MKVPMLLVFVLLVMTNGDALGNEWKDVDEAKQEVEELQEIINNNAGTERDEGPASNMAKQLIKDKKKLIEILEQE